MREYKSKNTDATQVCVPKKVRNTVLALAHDVPMAGHMDIKKTTDRLSDTFYWPGIFSDVKRYVRSCSYCQRTFDRGRRGRIQPLEDKLEKIRSTPQPSTQKQVRSFLGLIDFYKKYFPRFAM